MQTKGQKIKTYSSLLTSNLWSADKTYIEPSADSSIQRESPTDATVTTQPSIITRVTVVPEERAERLIKGDYQVRINWNSWQIIFNFQFQFGKPKFIFFFVVIAP